MHLLYIDQLGYYLLLGLFLSSLIYIILTIKNKKISIFSQKTEFCYFPLCKKETLSSGLSKLFSNNLKIRKFQDLKNIIGDDEFIKLEKIISLQKISTIIEFKDIHGNRLFIEALNPNYSDSKLEVILFRDITNIITPIKYELEELKEKYQFNQNILNNLPIPIWLRNKDNKIIFSNNEYKNIVNIDCNTVEIPEISKSSIHIAKKARNYECHSEDTHVIVQYTRKLFNITEKIIQDRLLLGFALDQSKKEKISIELQQYLDAQNNFLESSSSAIAIYTQDHKIKYFNQAFINLWGLDEKWLHTNPTYSEILEELRIQRKLPEQSDFLKFKKDRLKLFTELSETYDDFLYLPDGRSFRMIVIPFTHRGLLFAFEDITSRLALERSFNSLSAVQRAMINNLSEAIAVFGQDGRLKLFNPAYLKLWEMNEEYANTSPHISEILESKKHLFNVRDNNWINVKNDLISVLYEREFQRTALKLKNDFIIYRSVAPLPDGATLITYVNNSDLVKCQASLSEKNMIMNDLFLFQYQFIISTYKQIDFLIDSLKNKSLDIESFIKGLKNQTDEMINLSKINLSSINSVVSVIDFSNLINEILDTQNILKIESLSVNFSDYFNGTIICNKERIVQILNKILDYIADLCKTGNVKIEAKDDNKKIFILFKVFQCNVEYSLIEQKFLLLQALVDAYEDRLSIIVENNGFTLNFEISQNQVNKILMNIT